MTGDYKGLQKVTRGDRRLQGLQKDTRDYKALQGITRGYKV